MEIRAELHVAVGAYSVGPPKFLARADVERRQPAVDAHLAARIADEHLSVRRKRGLGHGDAVADLVHRGPPNLLAGRGVDRHRVVVEEVVDQLAIGIGPAANDGVTARLADRLGRRIGIELPLDRRAGLREIKGVGRVGKGRHQIYMVSPTTSGAPSCPYCVPSEKVQASRSRPTFSVVSWVRGL